jgi:hypothetical protein
MSVTISDEQLERCERAFWDIAAVRPISDERTQLGDDAFWTEMVRIFPEVETGDLDPLMLVRLADAERRAIAEWERGAPKTSPALSKLLRDAADQWLWYGHAANREETLGANSVAHMPTPAGVPPIVVQRGSEGRGTGRVHSMNHGDAVRRETAAHLPEPCTAPSGLECTKPDHGHRWEAADDPPADQRHLGDELACNCCGQPIFWDERTQTYWHTDPSAPPCLLVPDVR